MRRRTQNPVRAWSDSPDASVDPVAAFWLKMAKHARTDCLRGVHEHLARQRADFLTYRRERLAQEQHA